MTHITLRMKGSLQQKSIGLIIGFAFCLLLMAACAPSQPEAGATKLVIAIQPTNTADQLAADAQQLEKFLEGRLNRDVELLFPTNYAGVIEALRFGHAHAAFMSAWPLALARKNANAEVVLAEVREVIIDQDRQEQPYYFSYWVVRPDDKAQSLADLRGRRVCFPSPLSTSGYVAPLARAIELGLLSPQQGQEVEPRQFFGEALFGGGYAQCWQSLRQGQVDATVTAGDVPEQLYREVLANTRVIEKQGPIPSHGIAVSNRLPEGERQQFVEAALALNPPEHRALMRKFTSALFVGFKQTTGEEHLAALEKFLGATQLQYVERMR
ncbi:MAG TPA: phosphate/phosphite/phosphonate ABC transporter substrate-binding protein [Pyrinomonadaceae bacterium]|nr:phosphate/phosphite/phosphonate ABC transporter substrate-binding protein [Pyrinomonadaceae bacterium]